MRRSLLPGRRRYATALESFPLLSSRDISSEDIPDGGDAATFEVPAAHEINRARLDHLQSLGLRFESRSVLEVGGGVGHLAQFFIERGCGVVSTEARPDNVALMRLRYPHLDARVADVEEDLSALGRFEVVFCYGLLYHLENPIRALRNMVAVCDDLLLIETMVCDSPHPVLKLDDEYLSHNQALRGLAHRPSLAYIAMALDRIGMHHVYSPRVSPVHPDYRFRWQGDLAVARGGHLLRAVVVASHTPLQNEMLIPLVDAN